MSKKLYGNSVEPRCEYCEHGTRSADGRQVFCKRKGVMPLAAKCRKYVYDPLKRVPFRQAQLKQYHPEEFSLD